MYQDQEARIAREQQQQVIVKEEQAKKRIARDLKEKRRLIKRRQVRQTHYANNVYHVLIQED